MVFALALGSFGWLGAGLLVVPVGFLVWEHVTARGHACFARVLVVVGLSMPGLVFLIASMIGLFEDDLISEQAALRCAETSGIKVAYITEAQADPDEPLLHVPWDDNEPWSLTDLEAIDCGSHIGAAR